MAALTDQFTQAVRGRTGTWRKRAMKIIASGGFTGDTVKSGLGRLVFAHFISETSGSQHLLAINSNDGTEGSENGTVYLADAGTGGVGRLIMYGF